MFLQMWGAQQGVRACGTTQIDDGVLENPMSSNPVSSRAFIVSSNWYCNLMVKSLTGWTKKDLLE